MPNPSLLWPFNALCCIKALHQPYGQFHRLQDVPVYHQARGEIALTGP